MVGFRANRPNLAALRLQVDDLQLLMIGMITYFLVGLGFDF